MYEKVVIWWSLYFDDAREREREHEIFYIFVQSFKKWFKISLVAIRVPLDSIIKPIFHKLSKIFAFLHWM